MDFEKFDVNDVKHLLREIVLPRLVELEQEVYLLRSATLPVCQALSDHYNHENGLSRQLRSLLDPSEYSRIIKLRREFRERYELTN